MSGAIERRQRPLTPNHNLAIRGRAAMADIHHTIRAFKYRLYPNQRQIEALELHLSEAARLYNAALQERRDAWKFSRKRITFYSQDAQPVSRRHGV